MERQVVKWQKGYTYNTKAGKYVPLKLWKK